MRLEISFRNATVEDNERQALKARVERKSKKITRFLKEPIEIGLVIHGQKVGYRGDLIVSSAGADGFKAGLEADDPIAVVDGLIHTVERAVRRRHDRRIDVHRHEGAHASGFVPDFALSESEDHDLETAEIQRTVQGGAA